MMSRERIILADTDINYVISIQQKFAEELFEQADIEVITDRDYFLELFTSPQQANILIVSEELYNSDLLRHNIPHIFLMSERKGEDDIDSKITVLYKYTSVKEIYNVIIGKCSLSLSNNPVKQEEPQIILVYSANGGVGKTTVAMGISACLSRNYKRVLYIEASRLQTFQNMIENNVPIPTDVIAKLNDDQENIYQNIRHVIRKENFAYLPPFKLALMSLNITYRIFENIALSAKQSGDYDFIVVDADCTFDEDKAELLNIADRVILVSDQTKYSITSMNNLIANINGTGNDKYIFICNNYDKQKANAFVSAEVSAAFTVSEYIDHFPQYETMTIEQLAKESSLQKVAYLII